MVNRTLVMITRCYNCSKTNQRYETYVAHSACLTDRIAHTWTDTQNTQHTHDTRTARLAIPQLIAQCDARNHPRDPVAACSRVWRVRNSDSAPPAAAARPDSHAHGTGRATAETHSRDCFDTAPNRVEYDIVALQRVVEGEAAVILLQPACSSCPVVLVRTS